MLWVTQLERGCQRERETFGMNMDEEEAGLERSSGGGEAESFCGSERERKWEAKVNLFSYTSG